MDKILELEESLYNILGPELSRITDAIMVEPGSKNPFLVELPTAYTIDLPIEELASLVARTSNSLQVISRLAAMARAEVKIAKGRYERKFKASRAVGNNDKERDAYAIIACTDEHTALCSAEALAELAEGLEVGARVASESARKILDTAKNMQVAAQRETHGVYRDEDFKVY